MSMTISEMLQSEKEMLTPADISKVLKMHTSRITYYARKKELPFPCIISGNRVKFPRMQFLSFMGYGNQKERAKQ